MEEDSRLMQNTGKEYLGGNKEVERIYENVSVELDGKKVNFNFYHVGLNKETEDKKVNINIDSLEELTKKFHLLEDNPEIADGGTNIYLDYRSLPKKVFDSVTKKFGNQAPSFFSRTFGASEAQPDHTDEANRYIYVSKPSKLSLLFSKQRFEEVFKHEFQHLSHKSSNLDIKKEVSMRLASWAGVMSGSIVTGAGIAEMINTNSVSIESAGVTFVGGVMMVAAHKLLRNTPTEREAIAAQRVETEKPIFIYPENKEESLDLKIPYTV